MYILNKILRRMGFEVIRYSKDALERARALDRKALDEGSRNFLKLLTVHNIDLVLDVGANAGDWAKRLFEMGYNGRVVSFEPLSSAYAELLRKSRSNPQWTVAERCALGDTEGEAEINISGNSESSSMLPMLKAHLDASPHSAYCSHEKVKLCRLDTIAQKYLKNSLNPFMKIDVQGYEKKVLGGGRRNPSRGKGLAS
jgi:FkbM family methyltransferase